MYQDGLSKGAGSIHVDEVTLVLYHHHEILRTVCCGTAIQLREPRYCHHAPIANSTKDTELDEFRIVVISRDLHIRLSTCFPESQRLAWWLQS